MVQIVFEADITPVSIGLGGGSDNMNGSYSFYSFVWVIINDSSILDKAYCAAIIFDKNREALFKKKL